MELTSEPVPKQLNNEERKKKLSFTKKGYCVLKQDVDPNILSKLKGDLTVKPKVNLEYEPDSKAFPIYLEGKTKLYLPKFFGLKQFGSPSKNKLYPGTPIHLTFKGDLRDNQKPIVDLFLKSCQLDIENKEIDYTKSNGGIISVGCGWGKTVMGLYLAQALSRKTLVIVHKEFLMNQWKDRIHEYLPDAKVGFIQGKKIDIEDNDIVIGMLQSVSMKDYDSDVFHDFGFCIIDECHHISAEIFSRSLSKINSWYMLGLSATPKRKDGLSKVFEWHLGPYVFKDNKRKHKRKVNVNVKMIYYDSMDPLYTKIELTIRQKPSIPKMITNISRSERRNELITQLLLHICEDVNRKVLILGERREQLFALDKLLRSNDMTNVGYYIGGMKEVDLKKTEHCQIMLATYNMSSEGMDIPSLNTLMMISSKSDIEQSVGRILRKEDPNNPPIVYDIVDNQSIFGNQGRKRLKFYQKNAYDVETSQARDFNTTLNDLFQSSIKFVPLLQPKKKKEVEEYISGKCVL